MQQQEEQTAPPEPQYDDTRYRQIDAEDLVYEYHSQVAAARREGRDTSEIPLPYLPQQQSQNGKQGPWRLGEPYKLNICDPNQKTVAEAEEAERAGAVRIRALEVCSLHGLSPTLPSAQQQREQKQYVENLRVMKQQQQQSELAAEAAARLNEAAAAAAETHEGQYSVCSICMQHWKDPIPKVGICPYCNGGQQPQPPAEDWWKPVAAEQGRLWAEAARQDLIK